MPAARLCFAGVIFFFFCNVAPVIRQRVDGLQRECCVKTVDETITTAKKFGEFRSRDVAMATNFMAWNGETLAYPAFIVCAGIYLLFLINLLYWF